MSTIKKDKLKKGKATGKPRDMFEVNMDGSFVSEAERDRFINGDRQTRISLDNEDVKAFLVELDQETTEANKNLEEVTAFYYSLENLIREYNVGTAGFLKDNTTNDQHKLCFEDIPNPDAVGDYKYYTAFWRIGYCKIGSSWNLAALRYKINAAEGPKPQHEQMGDPIRLTHAPREVRLQASHHIRELLLLILQSVKYNKNISESALERITPLSKSMWTHIDNKTD